MATIPVSTVPAVSEYLLNTLRAALVGDTLYDSMLVKLGEPSTNIPDDLFVIGGVDREVGPMAFVHTGGPNFLQESYDITVSIRTWVGSGDSDDFSTTASALNARGWQLVVYLETAIREDPTLGGVVEIAYPKRTTTPGPEWTDKPVGLIVAIDDVIHVETAL